MKGLILLLLLTVTLTAVVVSIQQAEAAANVFVNGTIPSGSLQQGQVGCVNLSIRNNENFPIIAYKVGIHYDWMRDGAFYTLDFGHDGYRIESNSICTPGQIIISCDISAMPGYHQYFYQVDMSRYDAANNTWVDEVLTQPPSYVLVESPYKSEALNHLQNANASLYEAQKANYTGRDARAYLSNATICLNNGWSAYSSNDYNGAINHCYDVTKYLSLARIAEDNYLARKNATLEIIDSVNSKLVSVSGAKSPDARKYANESVSHISLAMKYIEEEDFTGASSEAKIAERDANNALNAEFMYLLKINETQEACNRASSALASARENIQGIESLSSSPAIGLLNEARSQLKDAESSFDSGNYEDALSKSDIASALSLQALKIEADYKVMQAYDHINAIGELKSKEAKEQLNLAMLRYNDSVENYGNGDYRKAISLADEAFTLANETMEQENKYREKNPIIAAAPGFNGVPVLIALLMTAYIAAGRKFKF
ncbi:MAG: hypothetical protein ACM3QV_00275 [Caulobacteraceae bacterium]